jgi:hypothetical protein
MPALPLEDVISRTQPSWRDIHYGITHGHLTQDAPSRLARLRRTGTEALNSPIWTLAQQGPDDPNSDLVAQLAAQEPPASEATLRGRRYAIMLLHLADHPPEDPLPVLEEIWCDFDHPLELSRFVPYMPAESPELVRLRTREENLQAMRAAWVDWAASRRAVWLPALVGAAG